MRLITKTDGIMRFLAGQETDKICAVLAHAEDGKLAYTSCCCLIGCFTANHPLRVSYEIERKLDTRHLYEAKNLPHGRAAEEEFNHLWIGSGKPWFQADDVRRRRIIPLLRYELRRRELRAADAGEAGQATSRKDVLAK